MPTHRHTAALASLALLAASLPALAQAQAGSGAPGTAVRATDPAVEPSRSNQTIERIRTEDGGSRIDELRVGGQTQSIVVQPKGDMPAYEIKPADVRGSPSQGGARMWNFLRF
jgi:hypothetical protein